MWFCAASDQQDRSVGTISSVLISMHPTAYTSNQQIKLRGSMPNVNENV
jgi:hypothetical protein